MHDDGFPPSGRFGHSFFQPVVLRVKHVWMVQCLVGVEDKKLHRAQRDLVPPVALQKIEVLIKQRDTAPFRVVVVAGSREKRSRF